VLRPFRCSTALLLLLAASLVPATALAQPNEFALVNVRETLTLRAEPRLQTRTVETLLRFQPVQIIERKTEDGKDWAKVRTVRANPEKLNTGWVLAEYLTDCGFATVDHDKLNVRRGPGTEYAVIMNYGRNFPVQVLDVASNGWVKVRDVDRDIGWVHPKLLNFEPHFVITDGPYKIFNIREGAGTETPVRFRVEKGYMFEVLGEKDGWLNVKDKDGDAGWISAKIVFGWRDEEYPKPKDAAASS
jgi:SH3-like domain-containing protein